MTNINTAAQVAATGWCGTEDEFWALADAIELAMETRSLDHGWTPSRLGQQVKARTSHVHIVLSWMVRNHYVAVAERGAWSRYYRRH